MDFTLILGATGATIVLVAFILSQLQIWKDSFLIYDFLNFLGSILLVVYAFLNWSPPFIILNLIWATLSFRDLIYDILRNSKRKESKSFWSKWLT